MSNSVSIIKQVMKILLDDKAKEYETNIKSSSGYDIDVFIEFDDSITSIYIYINNVEFLSFEDGILYLCTNFNMPINLKEDWKNKIQEFIETDDTSLVLKYGRNILDDNLVNAVNNSLKEEGRLRTKMFTIDDFDELFKL